MRTGILVVLLMAFCFVWPGCERNGPVEVPTASKTDGSDAAGSPAAAAAPAPTETPMQTGGEAASTSSDPQDETAEPAAGDSEPEASDGGDSATDSAQETDQAEVVMYTYSYPNGSLRMTMPAYKDKDGRLIKHGLVTEVSESGAVRMEINWAHGKKDGVFRSLYETGTLSQQGEFSMGTQIGTWTWWFSNGQMDRQGTYNEKNQRHGLWKFWDRQGVLLREEIWVDGVKQLGG